MNILNIHIIYLGIIFYILFINHKKKKKIKEHENPTIEYYEWKRLYFKMLVLSTVKKTCKN